MPSLEEYKQAFATALEHERASRWDQGRVIVEAMRYSARAAPDQPTAKMRRKSLLHEFAQVGRCTYENVRVLAEVYLAFREVTPAEDQSWHWHRHVLAAAHRTGRALGDLMADAVGQSYGIRELRQLRCNGGPFQSARLDADCPECKARVHVYLPDGGPFKGLPLDCPFCAARAKQDGMPCETGPLGRLA